MMLKVFNILFLILIAHYGTWAVVISGQVLDAQTNEPIPFAHVFLNDEVNVTNVEGEFVINLSEPTEYLNFKVSFMGYETLEKTYSSDISRHILQLQPTLLELEEVTVSSDFGATVMQKAFNRIYLNYEFSRHHMVAYYKESLRNHDQLKYVAEGIMDIYVPLDIDKRYQPLVSPIKSRKKTLQAIPEADLLTGHAGDMAQSSIWRKNSFLSEQERDNYLFEYDGYSELDGKDVYIINFEPRNRKGNTRGKIYIQDGTYAIVKMEYRPDVQGHSFWDEVIWTEEYERDAGVYKLLRVSYEGHFAGTDEWYHALLLVNDVTAIDAIPKEKRYIGHKDLFYESASESFTDDFWEEYNFIKLDLSEQHDLDINH